MTPLRDLEYVLSKALSLTLLVVAESLAMLAWLYGLRFEPLRLLAGMILLAGFYALLGLIVVARYNSVNEFLIPSIVPVVALQLPLLAYFDLWNTPWFFLHPVQPSLLLMREAFSPSPDPSALYYGATGALFWFGLALWWARRAFHRLVARAEGSRR